jgi:hypothetical protein
MANAIYPEFKERLLKGEFDFDTSTVKAYLVDTADYTYSATHDAATDLTSGTGDEEVLTITVSAATPGNGTLDATNGTFSSTAGDQCEAVIITATDTGATERLVAYYDTGITGMPVTLGGDVNINFDASGLFAL